MEWCRKRRDSKRSRVDLLAAPPKRLPKEAFPDEFADLLRKGMTRRCTGWLLLGTLPASAERELMLTEALEATTDAGPAGMVSDSYRSLGAELYAQSVQTSDGSSFTRLRRFQDIRLFPSVERAYAGGCRRIAVEYKCEPYGLLPSQLFEQYADDACSILCVDVMGCSGAFERTTTSTWQDLHRLIGALCWSGFLGTRHAVALYDAFVPGDRSLPVNQYERAADTVRDGRQLSWERQASDCWIPTKSPGANLGSIFIPRGSLTRTWTSRPQNSVARRMGWASRMARRSAHPRTKAELNDDLSSQEFALDPNVERGQVTRASDWHRRVNVCARAASQEFPPDGFEASDWSRIKE
jgi:hypothetical protein